MTTSNDVIVDLRKLDFCSTHSVKTWQDQGVKLLGRMDPYRLKFIFLKNNIFIYLKYFFK